MVLLWFFACVRSLPRYLIGSGFYIPIVDLIHRDDVEIIFLKGSSRYVTRFIWEGFWKKTSFKESKSYDMTTNINEF